MANNNLTNKITHGNCLEVMNGIDDASIDMILCDMPYGTTSCKWDSIIPLPEIWKHYSRIIKDNGAIVLTASQPFTSKLVMSNPTMFRYEWIWIKGIATGFLDAKRKPLKKHESILVFSKKRTRYFPIMVSGKPYSKTRSSRGRIESVSADHNILKKCLTTINTGNRYPTSILEIKSTKQRGLHPTQKPVELFKYLVETYTLPGELVLDNCIGSGTTAIAAIITQRNWMGIESDTEYCDIANNRINELMLTQKAKDISAPEATQ